MAGTRHHIIPQFLQRGFASREEGDTAWTWLYHRKFEEPREISTTDSIVSEHFYGKGNQNADVVITEFETTKLAPLVNALRKEKCSMDESRLEIAGLIAHLSIRTKLVRKGFEEASGQLLDGLSRIFGDGKLISGAVANQSDAFLKDQFDDALSRPDPHLGANDALEKLKELGISRDDVSSLIVGLMREHLDDPETRREMGEGIGELFHDLFNPPGKLVANSIRAGHIKGLKETPAPEPRMQVFEQFTWSIQNCEFDLILGDSATIFESRRHQTFVALCNLEDITTVLLPISTHQLLIGSRDDRYPNCCNGEHKPRNCSL